uniref:B30.2/SPRY domain-containing protein n=1 Tax=Globodera pallida TaxID=36090 RepID=A0A183CDP3_GLOPA
MGIVLFLAAICFVVAAIQLKTDASPPETSNINTGLTPQNQWNSAPAACHWQLTLSEREQKSDDATHSKPKQLVVEHTIYIEGRNLKCSVFAVERIPTSGIFYYEVKIESKRWLKVYIGLATQQMELNEGVGLAENTYAYDSLGLIWGHEVEGCEPGVNDRPYIQKEMPFNDGDVVGCGVDLEKGQIFYTKNGEIVIAGLSVAKLPLFPCVSLTDLYREGGARNFSCKWSSRNARSSFNCPLRGLYVPQRNALFYRQNHNHSLPVTAPPKNNEVPTSSTNSVFVDRKGKEWQLLAEILIKGDLENVCRANGLIQNGPRNVAGKAVGFPKNF